jgi:histidinol-phosphate aminotransferase
VSPLPEPRDDLRALDGYHSPQLDVEVRLNTNESPFPPPDAFVDEWTAALREARFNRYPDRAARELRAALGAQLGQPPSRLFCANGSNEVLQTLLLTYGGAGRCALVFEPTYALHSHIARITGTEVVESERGDDFAVDPVAAVRTIDTVQPAVVFICSPNNPTGTVEPADTLHAVAAAAERSGALLIVDEAYGEFADHTAIDLVRDDRPLVVTRTYSKVWSLAAVRLGFAVAPRSIVAELEKVVLPYHLSIATQLAGQLALAHTDEMATRVATLVEERGRLFAALTDTRGITVFPSGANFLLFRVDGDARAVWKSLAEQGVLVRDFSSWPRVEECLRVTVGTASENDAFLTALHHALTAVGDTR